MQRSRLDVSHRDRRRLLGSHDHAVLHIRFGHAVVARPRRGQRREGAHRRLRRVRADARCEFATRTQPAAVLHVGRCELLSAQRRNRSDAARQLSVPPGRRRPDLRRGHGTANRRCGRRRHSTPLCRTAHVGRNHGRARQSVGRPALRSRLRRSDHVAAAAAHAGDGDSMVGGGCAAVPRLHLVDVSRLHREAANADGRERRARQRRACGSRLDDARDIAAERSRTDAASRSIDERPLQSIGGGALPGALPPAHSRRAADASRRARDFGAVRERPLPCRCSPTAS